MNICLYVIDDLRLEMVREQLKLRGWSAEYTLHDKTDDRFNIISTHTTNLFVADMFAKFSDFSYNITYDEMGFVQLISLKHRTLANANIVSSVLNVANELYADMIATKDVYD
jgi:hypothetical protein